MSAKVFPMAIAWCLPYPLTYSLIIYFPRQLRGPISQIPCHPNFFPPPCQIQLITQINTILTCWLSNLLIRFSTIVGKQPSKGQYGGGRCESAVSDWQGGYGEPTPCSRDRNIQAGIITDKSYFMVARRLRTSEGATSTVSQLF